MNRPWTVEPATHEARAWLNYPDAGLAAFRALAGHVERTDDAPTAVVTSAGRPYDVELRFKGSGLTVAENDPSAARLAPGVTSDGVVREVTATLAPRDGVPGETRTLVFAPRWPGMGTAYEPDTPGVSVHVQGSNEPLTAYPALVRSVLRAFDAPSEGFNAPAESDPASTLYDAARYVRVHRRHRESFMGPAGLLPRLAKVAPGADESSSSGRREVRLPAQALAALFGDAETPPPKYGVAVKAYDALSPPEDDAEPLAHPKVEVRLYGERVPWREREAVSNALDRVLVNVLTWAGLPPRPSPDGRAYVPDSYFAAGEQSGVVDLVESPLNTLDSAAGELVASLAYEEARGEHDVAVMRAVADGGEVHVSAVAAEVGCSRRTVYRVADRHDALVVVRGLLRFVSASVRGVLARGFQKAAKRAKRHIPGLDEPDAEDGLGALSLAEFLAEYCAELADPVTDADAEGLQLVAHESVNPEDPHEWYDFKAMLQAAWKRDGRDPDRLQVMEVRLPGVPKPLFPFTRGR